MSSVVKRPRDPRRAERIVTAAREILREQGVAAITHRTAAARAGVPLGSTTYHFETIEDLLAQTLRAEIEDFFERTSAWFARHAAEDPINAVMLFFSVENRRQPGLRAEYELYIAALARPSLRPLALEWSNAMVDVLGSCLPGEQALAVATLLDGYNIRLLLESREPSDTELERIRQQVTAILGAAGD